MKKLKTQTDTEDATEAPPSPRDVMTIAELATYLQVGDRTVYRMVNRGELPGAKVAGQWRFLKSEIDRWLAAKSRESYKGADYVQSENE